MVEAQHRPTGVVALAERVRTGDRSAEAELVGAFWRRVFAMVHARTCNVEVARDVAQETMLTVLQALRNGQLRNLDSLPAFVQGTARNLLRARFRSDRRAGVGLLEVPLSARKETPSPADLFESSERMMLVRRALARLDEQSRNILLMTLVEGLKPAQIAARLGLDGEVVRQRKSRAVKKILADVGRLSRFVPRPH